MLAAVRSASVLGIDAFDVCVEVDVASGGLPDWTLVGLPAGEVRESRQRVRSALKNSGFEIPVRRVTIGLSPGDMRKSGTGFDLPVAIGFLVAIGVLDADMVTPYAFLGELGLDGTMRGVRGVLPVARRFATCPDVQGLVVPPANVNEACLAKSLAVHTAATLRDLVDLLLSRELPRAEASAEAKVASVDQEDFADVVGQQSAKRALEIAAAGGHACLLVGPPGAGKTMLARRLPSVLPRLTEEEALEVTAIHSVAGLLTTSALSVRPFRAPHHSISSAGLVGGGSIPRPGEVSLAHHGVLFLDELLEFPRSALESLRQPLEDGRVVIARAAVSVGFPSRFVLIAAMNPCPCGNSGEPTRVCKCSETEIKRYRARLSGPLADRIDMHVTLGAVPSDALHRSSEGDSSATIRERVERARAVQRDRFRALPTSCNAHASGRWLLTRGGIDREARSLLAGAMETLKLSARGYHRVLRVARTIADLEGLNAVGTNHVAEALRYRPA